MIRTILSLKKLINSWRQNNRSLIRKIKLFILTDRSYVSHLCKTCNIPIKWYGSSYGGFYIAPKLIPDDAIIYSFGIGKDISFDLKVLKNHKCTLLAFDPTPNSIKWIKSQKVPNNFQFHEFGISHSESGMTTFYLPENEKEISGSTIPHSEIPKNKKVNVMLKSFKDIIKETGHNHIDVLKMDIEGSEYEILDAILNENIRIDQILVEFHDRFFDIKFPKSKPIVEALMKSGFEIAGVSISFEEVLFIHSRKIEHSA